MTNRKYFVGKIWADDIKKRDSKQCVICGSKDNLEAHHIFGVSQYPYLTTEINNGITLCKSCHNKYHSTYTDINAITWTDFLLKNPFNVTNFEIKYSNRYKRNLPLSYPFKDIQPLLNDDLRGTILHEIQISGFDKGIIPIDWLIIQMYSKYGVSEDSLTEQLAILINKGLLSEIGLNDLKLKI